MQFKHQYLTVEPKCFKPLAADGPGCRKTCLNCSILPEGQEIKVRFKVMHMSFFKLPFRGQLVFNAFLSPSLVVEFKEKASNSF